MTRMRSPWAKIDLLSAAAALCLLLSCPAFAAPAPSIPEGPEQPAAAETEENGGLSTGAAAAGTAILVGAGAYTAVRKKWTEQKEESKPKEYIRYENHTREGTLTPEEQKNLID